MTTLVIVSHTPHYWRGQKLVAWGPTVREIDQVASIFDRIVHVAMLHAGPAPDAAREYASPVQFVPVRPAGGDGFFAKVHALLRSGHFARVINDNLDAADVVHVRCPANISLVALAVLALHKTPTRRWIKYAGNWQPSGNEALSYRVQRFLLERAPKLHRAIVTVNGEWPRQPAHVRTLFNPTFTASELERAVCVAHDKSLSDAPKLLFAGRVEEQKGVFRSVEVVARLRQLGFDVSLDIAGDGEPEARDRLVAHIGHFGIADHIRLHGWLSRHDLERLYEQSHFLLLPTTASEGFPKVIAEAMAYGAVPIASDLSSVGQVLRTANCGSPVRAGSVEETTAAITAYLNEPQRWNHESKRGAEFSSAFTYTAYIDAIKELVGL